MAFLKKALELTFFPELLEVRTVIGRLMMSQSAYRARQIAPMDGTCARPACPKQRRRCATVAARRPDETGTPRQP